MSQTLILLNLNSNFLFPIIHHRRVLIEPYFGKLPVPLNLVGPCLLLVGDIDSLRFSTTQLPQTPSMIIVTIAATRMYRSLINLFSSEM